MTDDQEFENMLQREAFDLVSLATFLAGLVLAGAAWVALT